MNSMLEPIYSFLACETPQEWVSYALNQQDLMLIDHCNCEKKAANTAISLIFKYTERQDLLMKMSKLAREELRHFEQVLQILKQRKIQYTDLSASRYATKMFKHCSKEEPQALVDRLIVGAFIEARSCERFAKIAPHLDDELAKFYRSLLKSESRHFTDYLKLAQAYSSQPIDSKIELFRGIEQGLVESADDEFRFHSGIPSKALLEQSNISR